MVDVANHSAVAVHVSSKAPPRAKPPNSTTSSVAVSNAIDASVRGVGLVAAGSSVHVVPLHTQVSPR